MSHSLNVVQYKVSSSGRRLFYIIPEKVYDILRFEINVNIFYVIMQIKNGITILNSLRLKELE